MDDTIWLAGEEKEAERWLREALFHNYWKVSALGQSWLAEWHADDADDAD